MKVISKTGELGLTSGKEYKVLDESAGYYKVELDNGNISYRSSYLFTVKEREDKKK